MIYWGMSKLLRAPRQRFHKYSEVFVEKQLEQMIAEN